MQNLDLLFTKVAEIDRNQMKMDTRCDVSAKVMEQILLDQQTLAKQLEATSQAVAKLTLNQMDRKLKEPASPTSSDSSPESKFQQYSGRERQHHRTQFQQSKKEFGDHFNLKNMVPKMSFPKFEGDNPCIWKDKCLDYFRLFDIPTGMWTSLAALSMDEKAAKWLHIYKQKHGLGDWDTFINAVEQKIGDNDYREALTKLLECSSLIVWRITLLHLRIFSIN